MLASVRLAGPLHAANPLSCFSSLAGIEFLSAEPEGFLFSWDNEGLILPPWNGEVYLQPATSAVIFPGVDWLRVYPGKESGVYQAVSKSVTGRCLAACLAANIHPHLQVHIDASFPSRLQFLVHRMPDWSDYYGSVDEALGKLDAKTAYIDREQISRRSQSPVLRIRDTLEKLLQRFEVPTA